MALRNENYIQVAAWMVTKLGLKSNDLLIFALIYGFTQDGDCEFTGSIDYMCKWLNASRPTVSKSLQFLCDTNLITKRVENVNNVIFNRYKAHLPVVNNLLEGSKETLQGGSKETLHNNTNKDNTNDNNSLKENNLKEKIRKTSYELYLEKNKPSLAQIAGHLNSEEKSLMLSWLKYRFEILKKPYKSTAWASMYLNRLKEFGFILKRKFKNFLKKKYLV